MGSTRFGRKETKQLLFDELNKGDSWKDVDFLKWRFQASDKNHEDWKVNFEKLEGNRTQSALFNTYYKIAQIEGYPEINKNRSAEDMVEALKVCFIECDIDPKILSLNMDLQGNYFSKQPAYQLWHLLYSYEDDNSPTGTESLVEKLQENFGFKQEHAQILISLTFQHDYGNLSVRALIKIYPFLEEGQIYDKACMLAGYNHSKSLTSEENKNRQLDGSLNILKKNLLRSEY